VESSVIAGLRMKVKKFCFPFLKRVLRVRDKCKCSKDHSFHLAVSIDRILEFCRGHAGRNGGRVRERERERGVIYTYESVHVFHERDSRKFGYL